MAAESIASLSQLLSGVSPHIITFVLGVLVGALAPTYYAAERMRGFGRAMFSKLPYAPPPGLDESEALERSVSENNTGKKKE